MFNCFLKILLVVVITFLNDFGKDVVINPLILLFSFGKYHIFLILIEFEEKIQPKCDKTKGWSFNGLEFYLGIVIVFHLMSKNFFQNHQKTYVNSAPKKI